MSYQLNAGKMRLIRRLLNNNDKESVTKLKIAIIVAMLSFLLSACATLHTKEVDYSANGQKIKGKRPGVLVVHEWWGHNEYARKRARMLADLGYTAFALDMYGDGKQAAHPNEAGQFAD